ncbi:hypothetical protein PISMIDRAFT_670488 [Pisolithus microcarpus 441]|uniref:Uncharacterized protein n=1 Tax=Pisolithus microcarpus 441 TaxID=765257 RepID=A0A0D0AED4_9AGAM|nr:hypothetical protein PISMIDRAFT_670488 [Pisolithus microcarpus 441]
MGTLIFPAAGKLDEQALAWPSRSLPRILRTFLRLIPFPSSTDRPGLHAMLHLHNRFIHAQHTRLAYT